jgi:extracellular factor (EF) 3-hydroxypalmitic acid methyl ester biosynthesis protein
MPAVLRELHPLQSPVATFDGSPASRLRAAVDDFSLLDSVANAFDAAELAALVEGHVRVMCEGVLRCEEAGHSRAEIVEIVAPARAIHARSPFVKRLQEWPRGYPGDFETVEYICRGENRAPDDAIARLCEEYSLGLPIAEQHRNKVRHQASRIAAAAAAYPRARILILACGSVPDVASILPQLATFEGEIHLNDADAGALELAQRKLEPIAERCHFVHGNALKVARRFAQTEKFDLVVAGGLFDYLPDRHITYLVDSVFRLLLRDEGRLFFTNITRPNPWRSLIESMGDWFLIERSAADIRGLCDQAGVPSDAVSIERDETGLAMLVDVVRRPGTVG